MAQEDSDLLEKSLRSQFGLEKLRTLNRLSAIYLDQEPKKALKYAKQAASLADNLFTEGNVEVNSSQKYRRVEAYDMLAKSHFNSENYAAALDAFIRVINLADEIDDQESSLEAEIYLEKLDSLKAIGYKTDEGFIKSKWKSLRLGEAISNTSASINISTTLKLARVYENKQHYEKAIENYEKAINQLKNKGDSEEINKLQIKIAELYNLDGNYHQSLAHYQISMDISRKLGDSTALSETSQEANKLFEILKAPTKNIANLPEIRDDSLNSPELDEYKSLAEKYSEQKEYALATEYYQRYSDLKAQLVEEKSRAKIDSLELQNKASEIRLLIQENEISQLDILKKENEIEKQSRFKNSLLIGSGLLLIILITLYYFYAYKRKNHNRLQVAYENLEKTQTDLISAEQKIKKLLGQQLSSEIAETLMSGNHQAENIEKKFVCIMFLDIRDFTPFAEKREPEEIIKYQNDVFGFMIDIVNGHHGNINQFLGDGFMATFGAPNSHGNDCQNAFNAAREILNRLKEKNHTGEIPFTEIGIGLHAGNVVTGNVGTELRKQYSITGNTVITAARIEQLNKDFNSRLIISKAVYKRLDNPEIAAPEFKNARIKGQKTPINIVKVI